MSDIELPDALPGDIEALLKTASAPVPPAGFDSALLARVQSTLATTAAATTAAAAATTGTASTGAAVATAMGAWGVPVSIVTLLVGAGLGLGAGSVIFKARPVAPVVIQVPVAVEPVKATPEPAAPEPQIQEARPEVPVKAQNTPQKQAVRPVEPKVESPRVSDQQLAEERSLIEMARSALARGDSRNALNALETHAAQFKAGQLIEERDALWVLALVAASQSDLAREHAAQFKRSFPESLLLPTVEAAVAK